MSYVVEVIADSTAKWCSNQLRFGSEAEAEAYGRDLANRWLLVRQWRVIVSDQAVNARWANWRVEHLEETS